MARLVSPPHALDTLACGFDQLAALLALTLGPTQGTVVCGATPTEVLIDSGTIARRVVALPDRAEDVGAMLLRNMVWNMHETYGDGAATAAALARAMVQAARKVIIAGANPMLVRRGIEHGAEIAAEALNVQAVPIRGQAALTHLGANVTEDAELGKILGEMFGLMGENTVIEIEEYAAPYLKHEYLDGGRWRARPASRLFLSKTELVLENPVVLVMDESLERVSQVRAALETVVDHLGKAPLLLIAPEIKGEALNTLTINHTRGAVTVAAAIVTSAAPRLSDDLADLALITGGDLLSAARGTPPERVGAAQFGRAWRAILTRDTLTIVGGGGQGKAQRISELRAQMAQVKRLEGQSERVEHLKTRIGRLAGGLGIVKIGAYSARERDLLKAQAKKAVRVLEGALAEGIVPGGGAAYLGCIPAVEAARARCNDRDEAFGLGVVAKALEAPFCQIVTNHGRISPAIALEAARQRGAGYGFDARTADVVCMNDIHLIDSLRVTRGALLAAASAAGMAISTDILVLRS